jgi:hypothetical protein
MKFCVTDLGATPSASSPSGWCWCSGIWREALCRATAVFPLDGKLSWITQLAAGVLMGVAGWLLYLAALVQQAR